MKVYQVRYEGEYRVVEAPGVAEAVAVWRVGLLAEYGDDSPPDEEMDPEEVVLLNDEPVLR